MKTRFSLSTLKPAALLRGIKGERYVVEPLSRHSPKLGRTVRLDIFCPQNFMAGGTYPLLLLNDGQDAEGVQVKRSLEQLWQRGEIETPIAVGIYAGDRMQEYGVASEKDFSGRGKQAAVYNDFILHELLPFLYGRYPINKTKQTIAGFSLGALSAVDIAWASPKIFGQVGAFSGSFWWRSVDATDKTFDEKKHRIMHKLIRDSEIKNGLKFWFQTGTKDEPHDRNGNGVIDSIDDTLDLIAELTKKGYRPFHDITYHEINEGEHNQHTWAKAMPHFLKWAFPV
jgi:enterochelin esterase-like enzyme